MLRAVIAGERRARLVEAPTPAARGDWAVVKVHIAPMCTEYKAFVSGQETQYLGHEAVGEVVEIAQPGRVKVGDRVVAMPLSGCGYCPYCLSGDYIYCESAPRFADVHGSMEGSATMAQYLLRPSWLLCPIPDGVSYERAGLACCAIGPSYGAFERMNLAAYDTVLIAGAGPVGQGAVVNAVMRNAEVFVLEPSAVRRDMVLALGARAVFDPGDPDVAQQIRDRTGGRGVDKSLDCSGSPEAQRVCIDATRRRGDVAFVGECYDRKLEITVSPDLIRKGLTLHGCWHYNLAHYGRVMDVIRRAPAVDRLVSHIFPMTGIQEAMETSASQHCAKILLRPWE